MPFGCLTGCEGVLMFHEGWDPIAQVGLDGLTVFGPPGI